MALSTPSRHNPWEDEREVFGTIGNVITWAQRTGHLHKPSQYEQSLARGEENDLKYPSMRLIKHLRHMTKLKQEFYQVNLEIQCLMQEKEVSDLTHVQNIEKRIEIIQQLNSHFQRVVQDKDILVNRLQQPFVGEFIKIEATYHKHVKELFMALAPILSDLSSHLENISWAFMSAGDTSQLEMTLSDIASSLAGLQTSVMSLCNLRSTINRLQNSSSTPRKGFH